jgi:GT2 family glycosyltransferase
MIVNEASLYFISRNSDLRFFASNNMSVSAKLFQEIGGFDPSFRTSEDRDFCDRWIRRGHSLVYSSEAIVYHHHYLTLTTFCRQHFNYGRGAHRLHRARAQRSRSRLTPTLQFYASVFRRSLFTAVSWKLLHTAGLMGVWQAANLSGFLWQGFCQAFPLFRRTHDQGLLHTAPAHCADADEERTERNV